MRKIPVVALFGFPKEQFHLLMESTVIALQGEDVIASLFCDLPGNFLLASHGISISIVC